MAAYELGTTCELKGLVSAAVLNGRQCIVRGPLENGRQLVVIAAQGDEPERSLKVKSMNLTKAAAEPQLAAAAAAPTETKKWRPTAMMARPGKFMASYDWRAVYVDPGTGEQQALPPGLEILGSLDEGEATLARIPQKWKLEVSVFDADGARLAPVKLDVGPQTKMSVIFTALKDRHPNVFSRGDALSLSYDGKEVCDPEMVVGRTQLFGERVSCRPRPSPQS